MAWDSAASPFKAIGFEPSGKAYFRYLVGKNNSESYKDNFRAKAIGDLDGDGVKSVYWINHLSDVERETDINTF